MSSALGVVRRWLRRLVDSVEEAADGESPVATPPPGAGPAAMGDPDRETSTNAQVAGAVGQPWPGNH